MGDKREDVCRLCLKCGNDTFSPLDESCKKNLKVVVPELNLDVPAESVICDKCKKSSAQSFELKRISSESDSIIRTLIARKNIMDKVNLNRIISEANDDICIVCLKNQEASCMSINTANDLFTAAFESCLPELDVNLTADPVICEQCHNMLRYMYSFKKECLSVEEKLKRYSETTSENEVDLMKVLAFLNAETEKPAGDNFLREFEERDEEMDILDTFPSPTRESPTSEDTAKQTVDNYDNSEVLQVYYKSTSDSNEANNSPQTSTQTTPMKEKKLRCYSCRRYGHTSKECLRTFANLPDGTRGTMPATTIIRGSKPPPRGACVHCEQLGHANKYCPKKKFTGLLCPPKPPTGSGSSAGLQDQFNDTNLTKEQLGEKLREANLAKLGCLRCFQIGHPTKSCKKIKPFSKEAKQKAARKKKKGSTGLVSNPGPQSQNRVAPVSRPQYPNGGRYGGQPRDYVGDEGWYGRQPRDYVDYGGRAYQN